MADNIDELPKVTEAHDTDALRDFVHFFINDGSEPISLLIPEFADANEFTEMWRDASNAISRRAEAAEAAPEVTEAMVEAAFRATHHPLAEPSDTERRKLRAALIAALSASTAAPLEAAPQVNVKPLLWQQSDVAGISADTGFDICYWVDARATDFALYVLHNRYPTTYATEQEAKAAAQADYERRILSAIEDTHTTVSGAGTSEAPDDVRKAIDAFNAIIDEVEDRCLAADGPVTPTLQEMREDELAALWRAVQTIRAGISPAAAEAVTLSDQERNLLKWLTLEDTSSYGECHGKTLDTLVRLGLAKIDQPRPGRDPMYRRVSVTKAGWAVYSGLAASQEGAGNG